MNVAVVVAHKVQLASSQRYRFRAHTKKAANIDNNFAHKAHAVDVGHFANFCVVCAKYRGIDKIVRREFTFCEANVGCVIHLGGSLNWIASILAHFLNAWACFAFPEKQHQKCSWGFAG